MTFSSNANVRPYLSDDEEISNLSLGKLYATLPAQSALDKLTRRALGTPKIRPEMIGIIPSAFRLLKK